MCECCVLSSFGTPPLVFIGGNHQPFAREPTQTTIGDQPHLATCHLRGGGARGPSPLGRPMPAHVCATQAGPAKAEPLLAKAVPSPLRLTGTAQWWLSLHSAAAVAQD